MIFILNSSSIEISSDLFNNLFPIDFTLFLNKLDLDVIALKLLLLLILKKDILLFFLVFLILVSFEFENLTLDLLSLFSLFITDFIFSKYS